MTTTIPIDKEALRAKYLAERDKRLRPDGNDQYLRLAGTSLAHYLDDPYRPVVEHAVQKRFGLIHSLGIEEIVECDIAVFLAEKPQLISQSVFV